VNLLAMIPHGMPWDWTPVSAQNKYITKIINFTAQHFWNIVQNSYMDYWTI
jgi:hypothetical protein